MKRAIRKYLTSFLALLGMIVIALLVAGYILSNQRFRFPLITPKPQVVKVELENAQAVTPGQGQTVRVAGVQVGEVGKVELEDGRAVVDMQIRPEYKNLIRQDATILLRPKTGLKDMFLEVDPGAGAPVPEKGRIKLANTATDVDPDEFLAALDADTRDYLKLLIGGAGKGLQGRGEDLRQTLKRLEPLHRDLAAVNTSVARRRADLKRLINDYGSLTTELSSKDEDLVRLVRAGNATFSALASEESNISETVRRLPGALRETERTLSRVDRLGGELGPTLESLRPAVRRLDATNRAVLPFVREAEPIVRKRIRPFTRIAQPYVRNLGGAARDISRAVPDLTTSVGELNRLVNIGAFNPGGAEPPTSAGGLDTRQGEGFLYWLAWTSQNAVSLFSTADAQGVQRRLTLCGLDPVTALERGGSGLGDAVAEGYLGVGQALLEAVALVESGFGICQFRGASK
ncbi:MAG: MlaD family protein [Actinomycetota bacterium]|nr:MlaD family protein [Actinomycetota bacterium]MDQ3647362.1 MlaD family protein [Actinomycetota bacterium]